MAKSKPKSKIDVTGLSIEEILNMSPERILKMNRKDLSSITSRLVSASNKRIRRLSKTEEGKLSPAYKKYEKRGKMFSVKGKNVNQLRNEFSQMKTFLNLKTSTVSGWKKVQKNIEERIGKMTTTQSKKFWKLYHKLEEEEGGVLSIIKDSDRIQRMLHQEVTSKGRKSQQAIYDKMMNNLDALYEELMQDNVSEDTNDVFTIPDYF